MSTSQPDALERARRKAYKRLIPLLFLSYGIAYIDRTNVAIAKLTMTRDLAGFDNAVIGFGAGVFFLGYFLLEIPGSLLVERWSARKWIGRIMITWGLVAAATAWVTQPWHFHVARFLLGLAEAGFFPGVIVFLTHWFTSRDRARAIAWFMTAAPISMIVSPKVSNHLLGIGLDGRPPVLGLVGWQWVYVGWGIPAVVLGFVVLILLTDRPAEARWLEPDEREALERALSQEKAARSGGHHLPVLEALRHPKVLTLSLAYFLALTGSYGVDFFMPSILDRWYDLKLDQLTWLMLIPATGGLVGLLLVGWSSDRTRERRFHSAVPIYVAGFGLMAAALIDAPPLWVTVGLFVLAVTGKSSYSPAFWSLPSLFLTESAAAGSIGLINSVGNLGGFLGPYVVGLVESLTGSFRWGMFFLGVSMAASATILVALGLGRSPGKEPREFSALGTYSDEGKSARQ